MVLRSSPRSEAPWLVLVSQVVCLISARVLLASLDLFVAVAARLRAA